MKKRLIIMILVIVLVAFSGCSVVKEGESTPIKALQTLGLAYSEGDYTMQWTSCYGWITGGETQIYLSIPLAKRINNQNINISSIIASLRTADGGYVLSPSADLSQYIESITIINDGTVINVVLTNPDRWTNDGGNRITNNTPITGFIDSLVFSVL